MSLTQVARQADHETPAGEALDRRLDLLMELVPARIAYIDTDRRYRFANRRYAELFGLSEAEIAGRRVADVLAREVYEVSKSHLDSALDGDRQAYENVVPAAQTKDRRILVELVPDLRAGRVEGVFIVISDITEQREVEEAYKTAHADLDRRYKVQTAELRDSEQRFRCVFEDAHFGMAIASLEGRFISVNAAYCELLGYSEAELLEFGVSDVTHPDDISFSLDNVRRIIGGQDEVHQVEKRYIKKSGESVWVKLTLTPIRGPDGEPRYTIGMVEDITAMKTATEKLEQTLEDLQRSNKELEQFAHVASHDLQEPLRKIQMFGDRLMRKFADDVSREALDCVEHMCSDAERMRSLIDDLLTFARVTKRDITYQPVDLATVVAEVVSSLEVAITELNATIEVGELPRIDAVPTHLAHLFQNLISNALKFRTPDKAPRVTIGARILEDGRSDTDRPAERHRCEITVSDNGIGFDAEYGQKIFGLFERLHGRGKYAGTGLGLAICRRIVDHHHGTIEAESAPSKGATFRIRLPLRQPATASSD